MVENNHINKKNDKLPELRHILSGNFMQDTGGNWRTPYSNKAKDRKALLSKVLLKEFNG